MPDRLDKYPIDNALIDDGWSQMSAMLDTAMPVTEKRRRVIPIWWWRAGIAAAVFLTVATIWHKDNTPVIQAQQQEKSITPTPSVVENPILKQAEIATTKEQISAQNQQSTPIDKKNTSIKNASQNANNSTFKATPKAISTVEEQKLISPILENQNTTQVDDNEIVEKEIIETKVSETSISASERRSHFELLATLMGLKIQPLQKAALTNPAFAKILIKHKLPRPYQHGIYARINYGGLIHNGYTYGYILRKNIAGKHNVQARLYVEKNTNFVHTVTENYTLSKEILKGTTTSSPIITSDTTISRVIYPFTENSDAVSLARQNNIQANIQEDANQYILLNSKHLGAGLNYGYQVSPRVELTVGLGFSRTIANLQYGFETRDGSELLSNKSPSNIDNKFVSPTYKDQVTFLFDNQKIFSRWDGYYEWGMNYKVTPRFSIGGLLRRGMIDLTQNDALGKKEYNNFLVMQAIYYFRK